MIYSRFARNKLVDAALRGSTITFPSTYYLALLTEKPGADDSYQEIGNINANGYARVAVAATPENWSATEGQGVTTFPSSGDSAKSSNNAAIAFPDPSGGNWAHGSGTAASKIKYVGWFDATTGGNLWFYAPLGAFKTVSDSDFNPVFAPNTLSLTFDK